MCGRFAFKFQATDFIRQFGLRTASELKTSYNIAPQSDIPVILRSRKSGEVECHLLNWGFIGPEGKIFPNARGESAHEKATFADSFAARRCLIPASGFYEWNEDTRAPYYVSMPDPTYLAFAGLWTARPARVEGAAPRLFCTILTGAARAPFDAVHHRFPVCLSPRDYVRWLTPEAPLADLRALVAAAPPAETRIWPVSRNVGRVSMNQPDLILPIDAPDPGVSASHEGANTLL